MSKMWQDIDNYLQKVRLAVDNGQNVPEIAAAIAQYGFDAVRMTDGAGLLGTAESQQSAQVKAYGVQHGATNALNAAFADADKLFADHRRLAKMVFRDDSTAQTALHLTERKKQALDPWLGQTDTFYENLLGEPDWVTAMGRFNITALILTDAQAGIANVKSLDSAQEKAKGLAQGATKTRNAALDTLDIWYVEFRNVARIALDDNQLLESLGLGKVS